MDRRTLLKGGVVLAAASVPLTLAADPLADMFRRHAEAWVIDSAAWDEFSDIIDCEAMYAAPFERVQVGKLYRYRDDDGADVCNPIYATTADEIRAQYTKNDYWNSFGKGDLNSVGIARKEREQAAWYARMDAKIAELDAIREEVRRIKNECGYSEAEARCNQTTDAVKAIESEIIAYVPQNLNEAARKTHWILSKYQGEEDNYLRDGDETLERTLASIACILT
jgi:hypothetical protein